MKCPWCLSEDVSYGYGIHPDLPDEPPRDLIHCNDCDKFSDYDTLRPTITEEKEE